MQKKRITRTEDRSHDRAPGKTQISICLDTALLGMVNLAAKRTHSSRSNYVKAVLYEATKRDLGQ